MAHSEMSYAPAYYQDTGQFISALRLEPGTPPASDAVAYPPTPERSVPRHHSLDGPENSCPSEPSSEQDAPNHLSDPLAGSYHDRFPWGPQPSPPHSVLRSVPSSCLGDGSILARSSYSNGAASNERRTRGSWTGRSSFMSSEIPQPYGVPQPLQKPAFLCNEEQPTDDREDGLLMLFRLSIPVPIFSLAAAAYAVLALFFVILTSPLRLCSVISKTATPRSRLCDLLAPALHVHERLVRSPRPLPDDHAFSTQWIYNDGLSAQVLDPGERYSATGLITVLILSAFLCITLLPVTWIVACFWVFAKTLGNPDGTERNDDGRAAVLGVTHWWQMWLAFGKRSS